MCLEDKQIATEIDKFPDKILSIKIKLKQNRKGAGIHPLVRPRVNKANKGCK